MNIGEFAFEIEEASDVAVRIVVRAACDDGKVAGSVTGPYCDQARTLPATISLRGENESRASVVIPDPCYCENDLEFYYRFDLSLERDGKAVYRDEPMIGLRRSGESYVAGEKDLEKQHDD